MKKLPLLINSYAKEYYYKLIDHLSDGIMGNKIKTIAVCAPQHPFVRGGAELFAEALTDQLSKSGYDTELITMPYKWTPPEDVLENVKAWSMFDFNRFGRKKIDLLITTKFPSYFVKHENKVLWLVHQLRQMHDLYETSFSSFNPFNKKHIEIRKELIEREKEAILNHKRLYSISSNVSQRLLKNSGIKSEVLYHPPMLSDKLLQEDISYGDTILSVGRIVSLKRLNFLLHALSKCKSKVKCVVAGTGSEKQEMEKLCQKLKIYHKVKFLGKVDEQKLIELYSTCNAVYFAPFDEDYGYVTLEAFFSKKPVLTSWDSGGVLEFVKDNINGFVVNHNDYDALANRIDTLIDNPEYARNLGVAGFQTVKGLNWRFVIDTLTENTSE